MNHQEAIERAKEHLGKVLEAQFSRIETMNAAQDFMDYGKLNPIIIGIVGGDGIGPFITAEAGRILKFLFS